MSHAFSRANLVGYQKNMYENVAAWVKQLRSYAEAGRVIPLWHATQCLTLDTVSGFSFGSKAGALESEDFHHPLFVGFETFAPLVVLFQQFPILQPIFGVVQKFMSFGFGPIHQVSWFLGETCVHMLTLRNRERRRPSIVSRRRRSNRKRSPG